MRLSRSIVGTREAEAVTRVLLEDGYLGMGSEVDKFEHEIATLLDVPRDHVVAVASGTAALHLAVEASVAPGCEVLVQSLTFISSFQAILAGGAVPIACDVNPSDVTLDLADAAKRTTALTGAVMPVHYASYTGNLPAIYEFARERDLRVIEDAAHAFGCTVDGRKVGSFGDIMCFSFDGIKNITCGEGGAIITADTEVLERVRDARLLGVIKDTEKRRVGSRSWDFDVLEGGYRYHMSNIMAAIGRVQLKRLEGDFSPARIALARQYRERLTDVSGLRLFQTDLGPVIPHIQPVRILGGRRDLARAALRADGIETGIHYKPNHLLSLFGGGAVSLPTTEQLYDELLSVPLHPGLAPADVDRVCDLLVDVV